MHRLFAALDREWTLWRNARVSKAPLGKYIILLASILHGGWAVLLCVSPAAAGATPVHMLVQAFGGRYRTAIALIAVAVVAMWFIRLRAVNGERDRRMVGMLFPQMAVLIMSALAGVMAVAHGHYADGVPRLWAFILSDQLPVILVAFLYSCAVFEAAMEP